MIGKIGVAIGYGVAVVLIGAMLKSTFQVTSPAAYFWFGTLTAWAASFAFSRAK